VRHVCFTILVYHISFVIFCSVCTNFVCFRSILSNGDFDVVLVECYTTNYDVMFFNYSYCRRISDVGFNHLTPGGIYIYIYIYIPLAATLTDSAVSPHSLFLFQNDSYSKQRMLP
jgi:hypothetical protein